MSGVFSVPIPFLISAVALAILVRLVTTPIGTRWFRLWIGAACGVIALQTLMVGLRFGYGIDDVIPVQRTLPFQNGPMLYLGFAALRHRPRVVDPILHFGGVLIAGFLVFATLPPGLLDAAILLSYLVYLIALILLWRRGEDGLCEAPVGQTRALHRWLLVTIVSLAFVFLLDAAIAIDFAMQGGRNVPLLIGAGTLVLLVGLGMSIARLNVPGVSAQPAAVSDPDLAVKAGEMLQETGLYRDPDLSLSRLARRLSVPARALSAAINDTHGCNLSQFVNDFRVAEAARLLRETSDPATAIMGQAGFQTRSNFYREFRRVHGVSPGAYRSGVVK